MKNSIMALSLSLVGIATAATAQETSADAPLNRVEVGFRFMPTISSFKINTTSSGSTNTVKSEGTFGFGLGGIIAYNISKNIGVQGEIIYNSLSQKYKDQNLDRKINVKYVNIPLLFTLSTDKTKRINFTIVGGPELGFNVGSDVSSGSSGSADTVQTVLAVKKSDFGVAYGAGLGFMLNETRSVRLDVGYRGMYGLVNISNSSNTSTSGNTIVLDKANIRTNAAYIGLTVAF